MLDHRWSITLFRRLAARSAAALSACAALASAALLPAPAQAAAYPEQPVRIIVAFSAGGTTDILARLVADHMSKKLGQSFIIENKPGAGGTSARLMSSTPSPTAIP
jgi:tripartite-type tricarboxylate transporter receptor subunit TctC